jgi:hypothetical protein
MRLLEESGIASEGVNIAEVRIQKNGRINLNEGSCPKRQSEKLRLSYMKQQFLSQLAKSGVLEEDLERNQKFLFLSPKKN